MVKDDDKERRRYDKFPSDIRDYIDETADRAAERSATELASKVRGWIEASGERGGELGANKAIDKLYAEIGKAGVRKTVLIFGAAVAAILSWLGLGGHLPK